MKNSILILIIISLFSCSSDEKHAEAILDKFQEEQKEVSKGVDVLFSDSAKLKAHLKTPIYIQYKTKPLRDEMPEGLYVEFYNKDSLFVESTLSAKRGSRYYDKRTVEVWDSVVVVNSEGDRLNTEYLVWNEYTRKITTDKFVRITTVDKIIEGYGLEADEDLTNYKIFKMSGYLSL